MSPQPRTEAGKRLLWMVEQERRFLSNGDTKWYPAAFDARLVRRIVEEFVPRIEDEMALMLGAPAPESVKHRPEPWEQEAHIAYSTEAAEETLAANFSPETVTAE